MALKLKNTLTIELNTRELQELAEFNQPTPEDYPRVQFKKEQYLKVRSLLTPYCISILDCAMDNLLSKKKYQYIDCKIHDLKSGQNTANGLWHLDCSLNAGPYYENYILVTGFHNTTEFVTTTLGVGECSTAKEFSDEVNQHDIEITRLKPCVLTRFWGNNVHRGVFCKVPERRLLLRLVNTDEIMNSYRI